MGQAKQGLQPAVEEAVCGLIVGGTVDSRLVDVSVSVTAASLDSRRGFIARFGKWCERDEMARDADGRR
jgi:hypothetical protein